jgi:hypothetical protein
MSLQVALLETNLRQLGQGEKQAAGALLHPEEQAQRLFW